MLRLEAVSKTYTTRDSSVIALHPTTLEIAAGDFVAVIGPSGSGKTTLLSIVGGMLAPSSGRVWLNGQSLYEMPVKTRTALRRSRIGFVFQTFNLVPYLTVLENVQVPLFLAGVSPKTQQERATALLEKVGLADRVSHKPGELSVGQQQRVALARTLANDPALILADEPTGNLDPETKEVVMGFLEDFHCDGRTIVVVTHDPKVAACAQKTIRLVGGKTFSEPTGRHTAPAA
jgi:putative ABC transport system ATP-binding protein